MKKRGWAGILIALLVILSQVFFSADLAEADVAPPAPPVGSNLFPSLETTNVRMVKESVLLDISSDSTNPNGLAKVTAKFQMRNLGDAAETMEVRFPLDWDPNQFSYNPPLPQDVCGAPGFSAIADFSVTVDGAQEDSTDSPCWAHFPVTFQPKQDVAIVVSYTVQGCVYDWASGIEFYYVLTTGAGWKDRIGTADITVRFPYLVNPLNFSASPGGWSYTGREVAWHFVNLEPQNNIIIQMIKPSLWQSILVETDNTNHNPQDGEAWGRLGKAYKDAIAGNYGKVWDAQTTSGMTIYALSADAYSKAVKLLPGDADWHYGYAELLCNGAKWYSGPHGEYPNWEYWKACITQLKAALDINPDHKAANQLLNEIRDRSGYTGYNIVIFNGFSTPDYTILTPGPSWTPAPTEVYFQFEPTFMPWQVDAPEPSLTPGPTFDNNTFTPGPTWTPSPTIDNLTYTPVPTYNPLITETPWKSWTPTTRLRISQTWMATSTPLPELRSATVALNLDPQTMTVSPTSPTVETKTSPGLQPSGLLIGLGTVSGLVLLVVLIKKTSKN